MFVINGRLKARSAFEDIARRLEAGLAPILQRSPGFRGYYVVQTGDDVGEGIVVYDSADDYARVSDETATWFAKNISPLCEGEPVVTAGEMIVSIEAPVPSAQAGATSGAVARPH